MNTVLQQIVSLILFKDRNKKISTQRIDVLLSAIAISALSHHASAKEESLESSPLNESKGYLVDLLKLAKEAGISNANLSEISLGLSSENSGILTDLGNGLFKFFPSEATQEVSFVISAEGMANPVVAVVSFSDVQLIDFNVATQEMLSGSEFIQSHHPIILKQTEYAHPIEELSVRDSFVKSWNDFIDGLTEREEMTAPKHGLDHSKIDLDFDMSAVGLGILALAASGSSGSSSA